MNGRKTVCVSSKYGAICLTLGLKGKKKDMVSFAFMKRAPDIWPFTRSKGAWWGFLCVSMWSTVDVLGLKSLNCTASQAHFSSAKNYVRAAHYASLSVPLRLSESHLIKKGMICKMWDLAVQCDINLSRTRWKGTERGNKRKSWT